MNAVDKERLSAYLSEYIESISRTYTVRLEDDPEDPTAIRMGGGLEILSTVLTEVNRGAFDLDEWPSKKKAAPEVPVHHLVQKHGQSTSWDAALSQTPEKRQKLYKAIRILLISLGPMTDDEILNELKKRKFPHSDSGVRTRRRELTDAGWIKPCGEKRSSNLGNPSIVWDAVKE